MIKIKLVQKYIKKILINNNKMYLNDKKYNDSSKKILCFNMLNHGKCNYGNKCMYAHSLNEQKIDPLRHKIYTIIKSTDNLSNINLLSDSKLYEGLLQLTKICTLCCKGICPGGYNCRNGAVNNKLKVCYEDLVYGNCKKYNCQSVHLTEKDLMSYNKQKYEEKINKGSINRQLNWSNIFDDDINSKITNDDVEINKFINRTKKYNLNDHKNIQIQNDLNNIKGILLTEKFLLTHFGKNSVTDISSDSENEEDVTKMINYLNNENSESDDESIFLV